MMLEFKKFPFRMNKFENRFLAIFGYPRLVMYLVILLKILECFLLVRDGSILIVIRY